MSLPVSGSVWVSLRSSASEHPGENWLQKRAASEQGGVISGDNPTVYNTNDPFRLWVIQLVTILAFSRVCYGLFYKMRQPRVVAEIIGGILLGPTAMGRIPGFTETIFPTESIPILNLCATLGLTLFLFISGLEIDINLVLKHYRVSAAISAAGLLVPFGFGGILSVILYGQFIDKSVDFGHFTLFIAVSVGITAFPILCRMLNELKLYDTKLGVVVISAGVGNDIIGWVLLALAVTLVNAKTGLTALWILLCCIGYTLFCWYPVRIGLRWVARKTGSLETGTVSPAMASCALVTLLVNSFFTDVIGLHAIFGAFLSGLLVPHDNGLATNLKHQLEPVIFDIFLPIYFALSGLKTDLGLLNTGKAWGYTILVIVLAYLGKFIGCGGVAKIVGFSTREACAIGTLMSCKGLLELIVINLGLQAGILTTKVFAMFVVHAVVLTFFITPLTALIYPERFHTHLHARSQDEVIASSVSTDSKHPEA
ncbi:Sodium/hydrogen exchanger [Fomitiporia mediterranea MF3/22]|uniref:Sodium/hydrogen exchanger n=1 Tax=Fomitiporia mediterranea (strain MF3/22) TaxID=694068 RepID=UPI0004409AAF|nr:Sodium/hydrogen exchanger [Fomitiporia mediterranea MF3/22]EJC99637.1 Sodium/hydrogen exchanger [Fomitiporia mediterranea MF3/22]